MPKLLLGTTNKGKIREYRHMLNNLPVEIITLAEAGIATDVEESAPTIHDNAVLKAREYAKISGMLTLADDSGLEVDALGGDPGPRSSRYAGEGASDEERNSFLLGLLRAVPDDRRTARFRCVIAVSTPGLEVRISKGVCEGTIARDPRGNNGFGYDPLFCLPELDKRMAELPSDVKNHISHRGKAMVGARAIIEQLTHKETSV